MFNSCLRKSISIFPLLFGQSKINDFVLLFCFLLSYVYFSAYSRSMLDASEARFTSAIGNCNFHCAWLQPYILISLKCLLQCCEIQIWSLDLIWDYCIVDIYPCKICSSCGSTFVESLNIKSQQSWVLLLYHADTYSLTCFYLVLG